MSERRIYLPLADIAAACGLDEYKLQTKHWPDDWAVPRDFQLLPPRYVCLVAEGSLPALAQRLKDDGQLAAAERLVAWCTVIAPMESHEEFTARHSATPREPKAPWFREGQYE